MTSYTIRPFTHADIPWALKLMHLNSYNNLTPQERNKNGFIQGNIDATALKEKINSPASVVATHNNQGIGLLLTATPNEYTQGPPAAAIKTAKEAQMENFFLYGPGIVAHSHRGHGVMRKMQEAALTTAAKRGYLWAVAFIENSNASSLAAHHKMGWQKIGSFEIKNRPYTVITKPTHREDV